MNNAEVAHRWAQRNGGSAKGSNFFYKGDALYSFGSHFVVAKHIESPKGVHFVVLNPASRSISTTRHKSLARRAIPDGITILAVEPANDVRQWVQELQARCEALHAQFKRARGNKPWYAWAFQYTATQLQFLKEQYDLDFAIPEIENMAALLEQQKLRKEEQERAKAILDAAAVSEWKYGNRSQCPHTSKIHLRVKGDTIETSWGATVPLNVAPGLWQRVLECRNDNAGWAPTTPLDVGHYKLNAIHENGNIAIGCHLIQYDELQRIAVQLDYVKE